VKTCGHNQWFKRGTYLSITDNSVVIGESDMLHQDHEPYVRFTSKKMIDTAVKNLIGIVEGIAIDGQVNTDELRFLQGWIEDHRDVANKHPFNELVPIIADALTDGVLSEEEKLNILWLCEKLANDRRYYDVVTSDMQRLHGVLGGIIADGKISEDELKGLSEWLLNHEHLRTCWPFDELDALIMSVMEDGVIDKEEHEMLMRFFADFVSLADDVTITNPLVDEDGLVTGVCAVDPDISFDNTVFCFTGASSRYRRNELKQLIEGIGAKFTNNVSKKVHYLIIGAEGNPCWTYSCYGRKVEAAVKLRKKGHNILLVHEYDFHDAQEDL